MNNQSHKLLPPLSYAFLAAIGIVSITLITNSVSFNSPTFDKLYPKPASEAAPPAKSFPATLTLDPSPAQCCGVSVSANGSSYYPSAGAYINIHTPKSLYVYTRATSSSGTLSFTFNTAEPGTYVIKIYQNRPKGGKLIQMSETPLDVVQLSE